MENVWTLMLFVQGQPQGLVLQYKTVQAATTARNAIAGPESGKVRVMDDYGRDLTVRAEEAHIILLQDVDMACEGNMVSSVKNNITQALSQVRTQTAIDNSPTIKAAQISQNIRNGMGAIRQ
jgi:hypothetical protein